MKISDSVKSFIENSDSEGFVFLKDKGVWHRVADAYEDLTLMVLDNNVCSFYITDDLGYKPILKCRDFLTDELNFELETEYGLLDVTQKYLYRGIRFQLVYLDDLDLVELQVSAEEKIPQWLLETARCLIKLCKEADD